MSAFSICCDFDGTISIPDSCDYLLGRYASAEWKELDSAVWEGRMTEREAFPRQIALLRATWEDACAALTEGVRIREGFAHFARFCRERDIPLTILSSGFEELIRELLRKAGVADVQVLAHGAVIAGDRWQVKLREGRRLAGHCSHCKCAFVVAEREAGRKVVYIGDGYTDLCPVQHADVVFATGALARALTEQGRPYYPFDTFTDIERKLGDLFHLEQDL